MPWPTKLNRFVCERQNSSADCGPACLRTIFKAQGWPVPGRQRVRELAETDWRGTSLDGIVKAAKSLGVESQVVELPWKALVNEALPAIAPVQGTDGLGHFVVLHAVHRDALWIADPANGLVRVSRDEFLERWSGKLVIFVPQPPNVLNFDEDESGTAWRLFLRLLASQKWYFLCGSMCVALYTLVALVGLLMLRHLVQALVSHGSGSIVVSLVVSLVIGVGLCLLFGGVFQGFFEYLTIRMKFRSQALLTRIYVSRVELFREQAIRRRGSTELLAAWKRDIIKIREAAGAAFTVVCNLIRVAMLWAAITLFSWQLAQFVALGLVVIPCAALWMKRLLRRQTRESSELATRADRHLAARFAGSRDAKLNQSLWRRSQLTEHRLLESIWASAGLAHRKLLASTPGKLMGSGLRVMGLGMATMWAMQGTMTFRDVIVVYVLLVLLTQTVENIGTRLMNAQDPLLALDRFGELLAERCEPNAPDQVRLESVAPAFEFVQVSIDDNRESRGAWRELSLSIPAGQTTALVVRGSEVRSAIQNLFVGLTEPSAGRIRINDVDLRDIQLDSLRSVVACIDSRPYIHEASVFENIALGSPTATLDEVVRASQLAGLHPFVSELPNRYAEVIGGRGLPLSNRQRRRVSLARAVLKDPQCIVLDVHAWGNRAVRDAERKLLREHWPEQTKILLAPAGVPCDEIERTIEILEAAAVTTPPANSNLGDS